MTNDIPTAETLWGNKGAPPEIEPGKVIARPISIHQIQPDLRQPRRVIPAAVRGEWDGDPDDMPTVLANWHGICETRLELALDLVKFLKASRDDLDGLKHDDPLVETYFDLLRLAASIHRDGLINPVRIARIAPRHAGSHYQIESGERRWAAYWLLMLHVSGDYAQIPAVEKNKLDVWAQAAENGSRSPLNAIGMARQLALLIMDMYSGDRGVQFDAFEAMLLPGEPDRRYYAQVAKGTIYPVKPGMMDRVFDVTGLKNRSQVSRYRDLLELPDKVWVKADEQSWTEGAIREYMDIVDLPEAASNEKQTTLPTGNVGSEPLTEFGGKESPIRPADPFADPAARWQHSGGGSIFRVESVDVNIITLLSEDGRTSIKVARSTMTAGWYRRVEEARRQHPIHKFAVGQTVRWTDGRVYRIKRQHQSALGELNYKLDGLGDDLTFVKEQDLEFIPSLTPSMEDTEHGETTTLADQTPDALGATHAAVASPALPEPTTALLDAWTNPQLGEVLRFLKRIADDPAAKLTLQDVLTLSRADIRRILDEQSNRSQVWYAVCEQARAQIEDVIRKQIADAAADFLTHLYELGEKMRKGQP